MSAIGNWFNRVSSKLGNALQEENKQEVQEDIREAGVSAQPTSTPDELREPKTVESGHVEARDGLLRSIIRTLGRVIEYKDLTIGKRLVIWLNCDQITFDAYNTDQYIQQVMAALVNERGYGFSGVSLQIGNPPEELRATIIEGNDLEHLQILENETKEVIKSCKAMISIFGGAGSLLQEQYLLSSDDMKKKMLTSYNIGSGQFPRIPTGYRENHIAIDDNPNSPMAEKNKYVSRMHAHIGFSEKFGFYLQVEKDGTRLMGKRTRIFRGEEKIECDNPQAKIPLQTGDLIELGKAVVLRYMQIDE